ncbi:restriction endonuclease [Prevotella intermedia]|jgi:type II restriction endonuclease hpaII|uniref:Restriction endonuclease n=1 Tax=Prevotella intermedia TaxID=28131 RepID=A0AAJ3RSV8_PREIN|nr:HpaII family restriction endonuclease [Prevotella intermedia]ATV54696.1 HpaII family restriction endonuclease [Prevotella intermedia]PJI20331.1 restriction endonuclease [Prevotella intermedia]
MTKTANKGEWSEIYVLLKLLGEKKLYAGDGELNKIEGLFYPILKVLRKEQTNYYEYTLEDDLVIVSGNGEELLRKSVADFLNQANSLLEIIRKSKGVFDVPEIELFMSEIHCNKIKASSQQKKDITIVIHDLRTGMTPMLGFSIKSQLGENSTLFNAGKTTNFTFTITGYDFSDAEIEAVNSINTSSKIKDRTTKIKELGGTFKFKMMDDAICRNNFILIDSYLPHIMSRILVESNQSSMKNLKELTENISKQNPLNYDTTYNQRFYEHKVKNFLVATALGMVPHTPWNGEYQANGGYLVVKEDGDVLCYHFYDRNLFEDYLYCNTKLETASSSRYEFGKLYKNKEGELCFKLNLQVRFK